MRLARMGRGGTNVDGLCECACAPVCVKGRGQEADVVLLQQEAHLTSTKRLCARTHTTLTLSHIHTHAHRRTHTTACDPPGNPTALRLWVGNLGWTSPRRAMEQNLKLYYYCCCLWCLAPALIASSG